jgi:hypothetical protein
MKYHNKNIDVAMIHPDLKGDKRCHKAWGKLPIPQSVSILKRAGGDLWRPIPSCSNANLDTCQEEKYLKGEKGHEMPFPLEAKLPFKHHTLDGEFKSVQLEENPATKLKIGANLPPPVEKDLVECLRANTDLFACSTEEMLGDKRQCCLLQTERKPGG